MAVNSLTPSGGLLDNMDFQDRGSTYTPSDLHSNIYIRKDHSYAFIRTKEDLMLKDKPSTFLLKELEVSCPLPENPKSGEKRRKAVSLRDLPLTGDVAEKFQAFLRAVKDKWDPPLTPYGAARDQACSTSSNSSFKRARH